MARSAGISVRHGNCVAHVPTVQDAADLIKLLALPHATSPNPNDETSTVYGSAADGLLRGCSKILGLLAKASEKPPAGLQQGARVLRRCLGNDLTKKLVRLDAACAELRHFTEQGMNDIRSSVALRLRDMNNDIPVDDIDVNNGKNNASASSSASAMSAQPSAASRMTSPVSSWAKPTAPPTASVSSARTASSRTSAASRVPSSVSSWAKPPVFVITKDTDETDKMCEGCFGPKSDCICCP
eukprot:TRINITY_DN20685_c1_g1_i2.p1 TRINITY_DN20685_c1_g1~~TRINITY_DN20685_c1_g1_i2.p1  ORF type:complete len:261 (+),score=41.29 TRINITY_DN20685_c1_g1_i2:63-785(+)